MARGTLRPGLAGPEVARLQAALGIHVDGLYGRQTASAVAAYQRACGLLVDGIAGPQTLSSLYGGGCSGGYVPIADCGDPCHSSGSYEGYYDEDDRYSDDDCEGEYPCYPTNRINQFGNRFPSRAYTGGQYVVVVPNNSPDSLTQVRRYVPTAFPDATLAGGFINAGQFDDYATAARTVDLLEGVGFDAQVNYREYYD
jgi:peptidoglycan hydrolase-like protein with peptidoglycan-binding domain